MQDGQIGKILVVVVLFLMLAGNIGFFQPAAPVSKQVIMSPFSAQNIIISRNTTIGDNSTYDSYYVAGNLIIARNESLTFVNTNLVFENSSFITHYLWDNGSLKMINSSISLANGVSPETERLNINVGLNVSGTRAELFLNGSSISIYGRIYFNNSNVTIVDSNISSASPTVSTPQQSLHITSNDSTIFVLGSNVTGLYSTAPMNDFNAGNLYLTDVPLGVGGPLNFKENQITPPVTLVKSLNVSVTYSGNNTDNYDYLSFNERGKTVYRYDFSSTGSFNNQTTEVFNVSLNGTTIPMSELQNISIFSVYFNLSFQTTIDIWNLSINLNSNDTEAFYGKSNFNIVLNDTNLISVKSEFDLNYNQSFSYSNVLNPEKKGMLLYNDSSVLFIESYITASSGNLSYSPFEPYSGSTAELFVIKSIEDVSEEGVINGAENIVKSDSQNLSLSRFIDQTNNNVLEELSSYGLIYSNTSENGSLNVPLLANIVGYHGDSNVTYFGNYMDTVDLQKFYFSLKPFPDLSLNETVFAVKLNLPELSASILAGNLTIEQSSKVEVTLYANFSQVTNLSFYLNLSSNIANIPLAFYSNLSIADNSSENFSITFDLGSSVIPGSYNLTVTTSTNEPTYPGGKLTVRKSIEVYSNVFIMLSANYSFLPKQGETVLFVNVSNLGVENVTNASLMVTWFSNSSIISSTVEEITILANNTYLLTFSSSNCNITSAKIMVMIPTYLKPQNTSGQRTIVNISLPKHSLTQKYIVSFNESGLKARTPWSIDINGTIYNSNNSYIMMLEPNGTYDVSLFGINGYTTSNYSLTVIVNGKNETIGINWKLNLYRIEFVESGLSNYTNWSVSLYGKTLTSSNETMFFEVPNGTYSVKITVPYGYRLSRNISVVNVTGHNLEIYLGFGPVKSKNSGIFPWSYILYYSPIIAVIIIVGLIYLNYYRNTSVVICTQCGHEIPRGKRYCPRCNSEIGGDSQAVPKTDTSRSEEENAK